MRKALKAIVFVTGVLGISMLIIAGSFNPSELYTSLRHQGGEQIENLDIVKHKDSIDTVRKVRLIGLTAFLTGIALLFYYWLTPKKETPFDYGFAIILGILGVAVFLGPRFIDGRKWLGWKEVIELLPNKQAPIFDKTLPKSEVLDPIMSGKEFIDGSKERGGENWWMWFVSISVLLMAVIWVCYRRMYVVEVIGSLPPKEQDDE